MIPREGIEGSTWVNLDGKTSYACIETSEPRVYTKGLVSQWTTNDKEMWEIEPPKESNFDKLYLRLK